VTAPQTSTWKRLWRSRFVQLSLGTLLAGYLRLIGKTTHFVVEPAGGLDALEQQVPFIVAMWHGQHFMIPLARRPTMRFATLISRHGDGEINAIAAKKLGISLIRGSGAQTREQAQRRGGAAALRAMLTEIEKGTSLCLTADVPKVARVAGKGIVLLARYSGRPIIPVAVVTKRRIAFRSWDRASIGTPFNRGAIVLGDAIKVAADADEQALETARLAVETGLDQVHRRAYAILGSIDPGTNRSEVSAARQNAARQAGAAP
jgi:lysophospholipid acyltransferase (LPLAT)-like uncharacterized protein